MWTLKHNEQTNSYYYESDDGRRSKNYPFAYPYIKGCALVRKEDGKYYFRKEDGKFEKTPYSVSRIEGAEDLIVLREPIYGRYSIYNTQTGKRSGEFNAISNVIKNGWGLATSHRYDAFFDKNGNFDEKVYNKAGQYVRGIACVAESVYSFEDDKALFPNGYRYAFRDTQGNLSEYFQFARDYDEILGVAIVEPIGEETYKLRDRQGNLSAETFYNILPYYHDENDMWQKGFYEIVKKEGDPIIYRDYVGNETSVTTKEGLEIYYYLKNQMTVFDLSLGCFANDKMLDAIMEREMAFIDQAYDHAETDEQKAALGELAEFTGEYIKSQAYEAEQARILAAQEAERAKTLSKENILGRMF